MLAVVSQPHILCLEREHCDLEASARLIKLTFSLNTEVAPPALWIAIKYKFEMVCTQYFNCNLGGCNYRRCHQCVLIAAVERQLEVEKLKSEVDLAFKHQFFMVNKERMP